MFRWMVQTNATELMPSLTCKGGVGEGCSRHQWSVQARANSYKPIFGLLRIRPSFYAAQLPTANPHPTLPLQARGGMTQALEAGTNSPNLFRHCEVVPRGHPGVLNRSAWSRERKFSDFLRYFRKRMKFLPDYVETGQIVPGGVMKYLFILPKRKFII